MQLLMSIFLNLFPMVLILILANAIAVLMSEKYIRRIIKTSNNFQGVATKITPSTMKVERIRAIYTLIIGSIMLVVFYQVALPFFLEIQSNIGY